MVRPWMVTAAAPAADSSLTVRSTLIFFSLSPSRICDAGNRSGVRSGTKSVGQRKSITDSTNDSMTGFMLSVWQSLRHCLRCFGPVRQQQQRLPGMPLFTTMLTLVYPSQPNRPTPLHAVHTLTVTGSSDSCARALTSLARERGLRSITAPRPLRVASMNQEEGTQQ